MLDNQVKREAVKAAGVTVAVVAGSPLAAVLATSLGVAVEALGQLGEKRTRELFDDQALIDKVIEEIKASDNFASFVYDIWLKHNFESSESRRKRLKSILKTAVYKEKKDFENFTRIIISAQQIDDAQIQVLDTLYRELELWSTDPIKPVYIKSEHAFDGHRIFGWKINAIQFEQLLDEKGINLETNEADDLTSVLNQLCYLGLLSSVVAMDGEYYLSTSLGYIFLEYIKS